MGTIFKRISFLISCSILYTGADVSLTTIGGLSNSDISLCNTTKTFVCRIDSYQLMIWTIDGVTVADCSLSLCDSYSTMPPNANFSYDTAAGIFNLTFIQVKLADSDKTIKCSNGSSIADRSITDKIKDYRASIEESTGPSGGIIKVTSGCLSLNTNMSITWGKKQANSSNVERYTDGNESISTNSGPCLTDSICGSSVTEQRTVMLDVTEADGGVEHFIQSVVTFKDNDFTYTFMIQSGNTYKLLDDPVVKKKEICCILQVSISIVAGTVIIAVCSAIIHWTKNSLPSDESCCGTTGICKCCKDESCCGTTGICKCCKGKPLWIPLMCFYYLAFLSTILVLCLHFDECRTWFYVMIIAIHIVCNIACVCCWKKVRCCYCEENVHQLPVTIIRSRSRSDVQQNHDPSTLYTDKSIQPHPEQSKLDLLGSMQWHPEPSTLDQGGSMQPSPALTSPTSIKGSFETGTPRKHAVSPLPQNREPQAKKKKKKKKKTEKPTT